MKLHEVFFKNSELLSFMDNLDSQNEFRGLFTGLIASAKALFLVEMLKKRKGIFCLLLTTYTIVNKWKKNYRDI